MRHPPRARTASSASTPEASSPPPTSTAPRGRQDPHLHTHVIVANMAQKPSDGKWRALDGEAILKNYRLAAGYLYQAQLRRALPLARRRVARADEGHGRDRGRPRAVSAEFSTRRAQVLEHLAERGTAGFYAARSPRRDPRAQGARRPCSLREDWRARAAEHGLGRRELDALLHRAKAREPTARAARALAARCSGRRADRAPDRVLRARPRDGLGGGARPGRGRTRSAASPPASPARRRRASRRGPRSPGRPARYSTAELIAVERGALALVERGRTRALRPSSSSSALEREPVSSRPSSGDAAKRSPRARPRRLRRRSRGAGKTTALPARSPSVSARPACPCSAPRPPVSPPRSSRTRPASPRRRSTGSPRPDLPGGCLLVVVDEAGMAETRVLARCSSGSSRRRGKAILVGDPHQLPPSARAASSPASSSATARSSSPRTAASTTERARALAAIRHGLGRDYLAFAEAGPARRLRDAARDPHAPARRLVGRRARRPPRQRHDRPPPPRRRRAERARAARLMETHGRLGAERLHRRPGEFAAGDRVVCLRNSDALGVKNGTRGTVEAVDPIAARADRRYRPRRPRHAHRALPRGRARPPRLRAHRPLRPGRHRRARLRARQGRPAAAGVGVRRPLPRPRGDPALRHRRHRASARASSTTSTTATPWPVLAQALEESAIERLAVDQRPLPTGPRHETRAEIFR